MAAEDKFGAFWQQYGRAVLVVLIVALLVHDVFGTHGFLAMRRTKQQIQQVQTDLARLNRENQQLADEVKELKSDPHKIESIARDELGLAKPGEVIIKIPQGQELSPSSAPKP
jgi:cell division protein FtsB